MSSNLLGKLYYVLFVFPPDDTPDFVTVTKDVDAYLGCSKRQGAFQSKREANESAKRLAYRRDVLVDD